MGLSHSSLYTWQHQGFYAAFSKWAEENCLHCKFSNMPEHMKDEKDLAYCYAELDQHILSGKRRQMIYVAIYYHKNFGLCPCMLRTALHGECGFRLGSEE